MTHPSTASGPSAPEAPLGRKVQLAPTGLSDSWAVYTVEGAALRLVLLAVRQSRDDAEAFRNGLDRAAGCLPVVVRAWERLFPYDQDAILSQMDDHAEDLCDIVYGADEDAMDIRFESAATRAEAAVANGDWEVLYTEAEAVARPAPAAQLAPPAPKMLDTELPFSGFYGSIWEGEVDSLIDREVEYRSDDADARDTAFPALAGLNLPKDFIADNLHEVLSDHTDYAATFRTIAKDYAQAFGVWLDDTLDLTPHQGADGRRVRGEAGAVFNRLDSPRFYNFETDRVSALIPLPVLQMVADRTFGPEADDKARETFEATVVDRHTSYDGFASHYTNDPEAFMAKPIAEWDHNELRTLIEAWARINDVEPGRLDMTIFDGGDMGGAISTAWEANVDWKAVEAALVALVAANEGADV